MKTTEVAVRRIVLALISIAGGALATPVTSSAAEEFRLAIGTATDITNLYGRVGEALGIYERHGLQMRFTALHSDLIEGELGSNAKNQRRGIHASGLQSAFVNILKKECATPLVAVNRRFPGVFAIRSSVDPRAPPRFAVSKLGGQHDGIATGIYGPRGEEGTDRFIKGAGYNNQRLMMVYNGGADATVIYQPFDVVARVLGIGVYPLGEQLFSERTTSELRNAQEMLADAIVARCDQVERQRPLYEKFVRATVETFGVLFDPARERQVKEVISLLVEPDIKHIWSNLQKVPTLAGTGRRELFPSFEEFRAESVESLYGAIGAYMAPDARVSIEAVKLGIRLQLTREDAESGGAASARALEILEKASVRPFSLVPK